jgi:hypothetical protein
MIMPIGQPPYSVVLFHTNSSALRAEKVLIKEQVSNKLIPTPREFSSDCGIALRFPQNEESRVRELLSSAGVEISAIHPMKQPGF